MMDFTKQHIVPADKRIHLKDIPTRQKGPFSEKSEAVQFTDETIEKICDLQYRLFVEGKQSLLIVLQAPDAAGKDGLIRNVLGKMNPQGCRTYPFKKPSSEQLAHDFLWRIHQCTPKAGRVSIFNRSHYEDVLVVRVANLAPKEIWKKRYEHINAFERLLVDRQTRIVKIYLHISPEEQLERFKDRLDDPSKHWKLNTGDYAARKQWADYQEAYEDVFSRCNSSDSPWFVIPADRKWYRNAAVAGIILDVLTEMDPQFPEVDVDLTEIRNLYAREAEKA